MTDELLDYTAVAALANVVPATLRRYRADGRMPEPDELPTPDRPRWRTSTINAWLAARPGRGAPGHKRQTNPSRAKGHQ